MIELLIVCGIIAVIAAIATISYRTAIDRARQRRTVSDMRVIASAWEARAADMNSYAIPGFAFPANDVSTANFSRALVPTYTKHFSMLDGWNRPFDLAVGDDPKEYAIRSAGTDGTFNGDTYEPGDTTDFDCDIVYANGGFVVFPISAKPGS